jgi:hypothetical protein
MYTDIKKKIVCDKIVNSVEFEFWSQLKYFYYFLNFSQLFGIFPRPKNILIYILNIYRHIMVKPIRYNNLIGWNILIIIINSLLTKTSGFHFFHCKEKMTKEITFMIYNLYKIYWKKIYTTLLMQIYCFNSVLGENITSSWN